MVDGEPLAQIEHRKACKDAQGDDLLHDLEFGSGIDRMADPVGRNREAIFKQRDGPAEQNDHQKRPVGVFQMPVPGEGHEDV